MDYEDLNNKLDLLKNDEFFAKQLADCKNAEEVSELLRMKGIEADPYDLKQVFNTIEEQCDGCELNEDDLNAVSAGINGVRIVSVVARLVAIVVTAFNKEVSRRLSKI